MSIEKAIELNKKAAAINKQRQVNEANREVYTKQLNELIAKADEQYGFGLAAALEDGLPSLTKRLKSVLETETEKLNSENALVEQLVALYEQRDYAGMRSLLGKKEGVSQVVAEAEAEATAKAEAEAVERAAQAAEAAKSPAEKVGKADMTAFKDLAPEAPIAPEQVEEDDDDANFAQYTSAGKPESPKAAPDLFAGLGATLGADEEPVKEEAAPEAPKADTQRSTAAQSFLAGMFDADDEDDVPATKPQTAANIFADSEDDDDSPKADFGFGDMLKDTDLG